jgi:hypothetical protein
MSSRGQESLRAMARGLKTGQTFPLTLILALRQVGPEYGSGKAQFVYDPQGPNEVGAPRDRFSVLLQASVFGAGLIEIPLSRPRGSGVQPDRYRPTPRSFSALEVERPR